jgi:hypothetical protein
MIPMCYCHHLHQHYLKGPWHEIYDPGTWAKAFLNMASNLQRKSTIK